MNVRKLTFGMVAFIGLGLAVTLNAFTASKVTTLKYRYNGSDAAGTTALSNWSDVSNQPNPEGCDGQEIPCLVQFTSIEYANMAAFIAAHNSPALIQSSGKVTAQKDEQ